MSLSGSILPLFAPLFGLAILQAVSTETVRTAETEVPCPEQDWQIPCLCYESRDEDRVMKVIDCSGRHLRTVPGFQMFQGHTFDKLRLNNNAIGSLPKDALLGLNVRAVVLDNNTLSTIFDKAFHQTNGIIEISMNNCGLQSIPSALSQLTSLKKLELAHNLIAQVPLRLLEPLTHLQVLNLSHNAIDLISGQLHGDAFTGLKNLTVLDLSYNKLHTCPVGLLANLSKLRELVLAHNDIKSLQENLLPASNIEHLDLRENPISINSGQYPFDALSKLRVLRLSHCDIGTLSARLFHTSTHLQELSLAYCSIDRIEPKSLSSFRELEALDVSGIGLEQSEQIFADLYNRLVSLALSSTNLTKIPINLLTKFPLLRKIILNGNLITTLEKGSFRGLKQPNLEIHLEQNGLKTISSEVLSGIELPVKLFLANNQLKDISFLEDEFCLFDRSEIDISGNPLQCHCESIKTLQRKLPTLRGECAFEAATKRNEARINRIDKNQSYNFDVTVPFETTDHTENMTSAENACNLENRNAMKYSCCSNQWVAHDTVVTCEIVDPSAGTAAITMEYSTVLAIVVILQRMVYI